MRLRVYLLGDNHEYMSVYLMMMKGEYDNMLKWPFQHKVKLSLINQKNHIFNADPESSSFQKPEQEMNKGSGCPMFVSYSTLCNGDFIVDDCSSDAA